MRKSLQQARESPSHPELAWSEEPTLSRKAVVYRHPIYFWEELGRMGEEVGLHVQSLCWSKAACLLLLDSSPVSPNLYQSHEKDLRYCGSLVARETFRETALGI